MRIAMIPGLPDGWGAHLADISTTLELATRFREDAKLTQWPEYTERMLRAAADLETFARGTEETQAPSIARSYAI